MHENKLIDYLKQNHSQNFSIALMSCVVYLLLLDNIIVLVYCPSVSIEMKTKI